MSQSISSRTDPHFPRLATVLPPFPLSPLGRGEKLLTWLVGPVEGPLSTPVAPQMLGQMAAKPL
jgi:hypothetical protein